MGTDWLRGGDALEVAMRKVYYGKLTEAEKRRHT